MLWTIPDTGFWISLIVVYHCGCQKFLEVHIVFVCGCREFLIPCDPRICQMLAEQSFFMRIETGCQVQWTLKYKVVCFAPPSMLDAWNVAVVSGNSLSFIQTQQAWWRVLVLTQVCICVNTLWCSLAIWGKTIELAFAICLLKITVRGNSFGIQAYAVLARNEVRSWLVTSVES